MKCRNCKKKNFYSNFKNWKTTNKQYLFKEKKIYRELFSRFISM